MNLLGEELRITENCFSANEEYRVEGLTDSAIESNIRDAKILFSLWNLKDKQWVYEHYVPALEDHIPMLGNEIDFRETLGVINNLKTVNFPVSLLPRPDRGLESFWHIGHSQKEFLMIIPVDPVILGEAIVFRYSGSHCIFNESIHNRIFDEYPVTGVELIKPLFWSIGGGYDVTHVENETKEYR